MSHPETEASLGTRWRRHRWLWVLVGVLVIIVGTTATIWAFHARTTDAHSDCAMVEQLGPEWTAMQNSVAALQNGSGETKDLIAIADQESAMSDKIGAVGSSVSAQALKDQLSRWAEGTALTAEDQRDAASQQSDQSSQSPETDADADTVRAATMTYNATAALRTACPNLKLS